METAKTVNDVAEQTRAGSQNNLIVNAVENYPRIKKMFDQGRPGLESLQMPPNTPAMIIGSGASLDDHIEGLRKWKGLVYATAQTYPALMVHGIVPQFVTCVDSSIDDVEPLRGEGNCYTTLITHPSINPEMLEAWKGPVIFVLINFDDEVDTLYRAMYPFISFNVGAQGCVSNMQLIMAHALHNNPVILAGVDMSYVKGRKRATEWRKVGNWRWEAKPFETKADAPEVEIPLVFQFYRYLLAVIWKGTGVNLLKLGKYGLDIIPEISLESACAGNFPKPMEHHELVKLVDAYTVPNGVYGNMTEGKIRMIEFAERLKSKPRNDQEKEMAKLWSYDEAEKKWRRSK